jgi:hypothetical protein
MLFTGVLLYAPTVLLPAFEQLLMGYTAQQAGETMSPGGFSMCSTCRSREPSWPASTLAS